MRVPKILSSIVSGLRSDVKTDILKNNLYNVPLDNTGFYSGQTNSVPKTVVNPYGFETACENFKDVTITQDLLRNHPQLVINGDFIPDTSYIEGEV